MFITACFVLLFSVACKKNNDKSPQELILGKWKLDTYITHDHSPGSDTRDTTDASSYNYYFDFRSDEKLYTYFLGIKDTSGYKMINASILLINKDTNDVSTLTQNQFSLYYKSGNPTTYSENWYNFIK